MVVKTEGIGLSPLQMIFNDSTMEALKTSRNSETPHENDIRDPNRCLMARVLDQAIWDLETVRVNIQNKTANKQMIARYLYQTTNWFKKGTWGNVTFNFICDILDVDPESMISVLERRGILPDTSTWAVDLSGDFVEHSGVIKWKYKLIPAMRTDVKFEVPNPKNNSPVEDGRIHTCGHRKVDSRGNDKKRRIRFR